jgi:hypothetical protein
VTNLCPEDRDAIFHNTDDTTPIQETNRRPEDREAVFHTTDQVFHGGQVEGGGREERAEKERKRQMKVGH